MTAQTTGHQTTEQDLSLAVVIGSVRRGRFGEVIAQWFVDEARQHGLFTVDLVDLADNPLPAELPATPEEIRSIEARAPELVALAGRLAAADAFVMVTPEYNHSFPAAIKHLIDWHVTEWQAKPVGFVSYGGMGGGHRAVEQLRLVFAETHSTTVRDTVSFAEPWFRFGGDGQPVDPDGPHGAATVLLDQLGWWAAALRQARRTSPYQAG